MNYKKQIQRKVLKKAMLLFKQMIRKQKDRQKHETHRI